MMGRAAGQSVSSNEIKSLRAPATIFATRCSATEIFLESQRAALVFNLGTGPAAPFGPGAVVNRDLAGPGDFEG